MGVRDSATEEQLHDRFVRWQEITRTQMSYAIGLLLGFAGATIGFGVNLLTTADLNSLPLAERFIFFLAMVLLTLSMAPGLVAVGSRLTDFRKTTKLTNLRWKSPEKTSDIADLECETRCLGKWTWRLFYCQINLFSAGIAFIGFALIVYAYYKLF